jgi:hypothetical protein
MLKNSGRRGAPQGPRGRSGDHGVPATTPGPPRRGLCAVGWDGVAGPRGAAPRIFRGLLGTRRRDARLKACATRSPAGSLLLVFFVVFFVSSLARPSCFRAQKLNFTRICTLRGAPTTPVCPNVVALQLQERWSASPAGSVDVCNPAQSLPQMHLCRSGSGLAGVESPHPPYIRKCPGGRRLVVPDRPRSARPRSRLGREAEVV